VIALFVSRADGYHHLFAERQGGFAEGVAKSFDAFMRVRGLRRTGEMDDLAMAGFDEVFYRLAHGFHVVNDDGIGPDPAHLLQQHKRIVML
jgi:hypothetical protein